jgi:hypothetical protein
VSVSQSVAPPVQTLQALVDTLIVVALASQTAVSSVQTLQALLDTLIVVVVASQTIVLTVQTLQALAYTLTVVGHVGRRRACRAHARLAHGARCPSGVAVVLAGHRVATLTEATRALLPTRKGQ